jgi:hypothetical protein
MSEGWIKLYRKLQDNRIWNSEPFSRGQAWIDLLLLANHEPGIIYIRDHRIEIGRGVVGWSENRLAQRWQWSRTKVRKFLKDLEKEQQIKQEKNKSYSTIRIENYNIYQQKEQQKEQQKDNRKTTERQQKDTNKNGKNEKNDKKGRFTPPQLTEVREYMKEKNTNGSDAERFIDFYESKGWYVGKNKMKDWRAAVRNWISRNKTTTEPPAGFPR